MHKLIFCTFSIEGFHLWKEASAYSSEEYLASKHRHMFYFKCSASVIDSDREIEFISMGRAIKDYLESTYGHPCDFNNMSCEKIAELVIIFMRSKYGERRYSVTVLEDNENGSMVFD